MFFSDCFVMAFTVCKVNENLSELYGIGCYFSIFYPFMETAIFCTKIMVNFVAENPSFHF